MKTYYMKSHIKQTRLVLLLLLFLVACTGPESSGSIEIILNKFHDAHSDYVMVAAHRASHNDHPENSISAITHAIDLGVDIVELDVKINGTVTGETVPTLEEALRVIHGRIMVDIDLKTDDVEAIVEIVKSTDTQTYVFYFDNDYDVLNEIIGLEESSMIMPRAYSYEMADSALNLFTPQVVHIDPSFYTAEVTKLIRNKNARIWINALGDFDEMIRKGDVEEAMNKLLLYNANIIQTDEPELLIKYLISNDLRN